MKLKPKKFYFYVGITLIPLVLLLAIMVFVVPKYSNMMSTTPVVQYRLTNVPYVGLHNNLGIYRDNPYLRNDLSAAVIMAIDYWEPGVSDKQGIDTFFALTDDGKAKSITTIGSYLTKQDNGYRVTDHTFSLSDLLEYFKTKQPIPLLVRIPLAVGLPATVNYAPVSVLIGIDSEKSELYFHSYWHGAYYTLSFSDFEQRQGWFENPDDRWHFVAIMPYLAEMVQDSTETDHHVKMEFNSPKLSAEWVDIYNTYALASILFAAKEFVLAENYYTDIVENQNFEKVFSPTQRVLIRTRLAETKMVLEKYDEALMHAEAAIAINQNLNVSFEHYGPYEYLYKNNAPGYQDRLSLPYLVLCDVYRLTDNYKDALVACKNAVAVYPRHNDVYNQIDLLQQILTEHDG